MSGFVGRPMGRALGLDISLTTGRGPGHRINGGSNGGLDHLLALGPTHKVGHGVGREPAQVPEHAFYHDPLNCGTQGPYYGLINDTANGKAHGTDHGRPAIFLNKIFKNK